MLLNVDSTLARFNAALSRYIAAHEGRKAVNDIMEAKGRDIGIRLFQGFRERKWGGSGRASRTLARQELDARASRGQGIRVRKAILDDYTKARTLLRGRQRGKELTGARIEARTRLWRSAVGRELAARQRGIGVLAAAFLWVRRNRRFSTSQQRYVATGREFVRNRSGRRFLGYVDRLENSFRIVGDVPGLVEVDSRYGVVDAALSGATADIEQYFRERPQYWQFWNTFNTSAQPS